MKLITQLSNAVLFVSEAFFEIFSHSDNYPATGMQAFSGDVYGKWN
jgi:hypothetical protein